MSRRATSECILPSTLTAYGGSGCSSMASSSDGIVVAAATDDVVNVYPVSSIWMPCVSLPIPIEIYEFNRRLHNRICKYPECLYKNKYPKYVKPDNALSRRKFAKKRSVIHGTIQMLHFHGENNEYLVGVGPFLFVIYDLRTMAMKPIVCMDMRYFGVDSYSYPYQLQASLETLNITRDFMYNNQKFSCIDFIFSFKPFVPTYFRVLFNEEQNWWVVDCRSTVAIISKDSLDEEVPYVFYNHDNSKLPETDGNLDNEDDMGQDDYYEQEDNYNQENNNNNKEENKDEMEQDDEDNETKEFTRLNGFNELRNNMDLVQSDIGVTNPYMLDTGFYNSLDGDTEMNLDGSETRLSNVVNNGNMMYPENMETKTGDTTPNNYDSENYESDNNYEQEDNYNNLDQENDNNNQENKEEMDDDEENEEEDMEEDNNEQDNENNNSNLTHVLTKAFVGVYHPFCILEKKVDFQRSKINELAKKIKEGQLRYNQEFLIVTFVPLGTIVMINFTVENKYYIRNSKVEFSQLGQTNSKILTDHVLSGLASKVHTFCARRHGRVFTLILNERFFVLKYTAPTVVSVDLEEEGQESSEYLKLENNNNNKEKDNNNQENKEEMDEDNNEQEKTKEKETQHNNKDKQDNKENEENKEPDENNKENEEKMEEDKNNREEEKLKETTDYELLLSNNVNRNYRICYVDDDVECSIYTHYSHYDPVLKLHYTVASFDLSKSDGYMAICTNYTSQWGLQIFSLASQTGIDGLRLVLDSSKCKGFSHISWLPYTKKLLAISRINGELFLLEPKTQRNWVGLIPNFTCIDKNVEYIESEDAFDIGPDGEMTSPIAVKQEFSLSKIDPNKDEKYKGLGWKEIVIGIRFFIQGFLLLVKCGLNIIKELKLQRKFHCTMLMTKRSRRSITCG